MAKSYVVFLVYHYMFLVVVSRSVIKFLPGFEGPLPFELETGYIGVDESEDAQLFYYFVKSETNPKHDPLMIWLTGGPACSVASALFNQMGPLTFKLDEYNGSLPGLVSTSYSWTKVASVIFLDSPVGSGFSYAKKASASQASDSIQVRQIEQFLRKWLMDHPEFISNPLYVGGDSYSGLIVPPLVQSVHIGNEHGVAPPINLQGYVLGNPTTNRSSDKSSRIPFAHGMGLISDELYQSLERNCGGNYFDVDPSDSQCLKDLQAFHGCVSSINPVHVLSEECGPETVKQRVMKILGETLEPTLSIPWLGCDSYPYVLLSYWANDENVRRALRVRQGSIGRWRRCNQDNIPYTKDMSSSFEYHVNNSAKGFWSLIYRSGKRSLSFTFSGDHDLVVPFLGTQKWIRALNYSIIDDWRPWMIDDQIAGYTRAYANRMTFATIKGGGHNSDYKPKECSVMFERWIRREPL